MFFFFAFSSTSLHTCNADEIQSKIEVKYMPEKTSKRKLMSTEKQKMRFWFNYDYLDGTKTDPDMCTEAGQKITFQKIEYTCKKEDVVTSEQIEALKGTMENARTFLQDTLKVIPYDEKFTLSYVDGYTPSSIQGTEVSGSDFYMHVLLRTYGSSSSTLASASSISALDKSKRPIQGACWVNARHCPSTVQNIDTTNCEFFYVCIHEIFHALGISSNNFKNFHPQDDFTPFESTNCSLTSYGITRTYLITPYAHKFAVKHFGVETFSGDDDSTCPSGIELEDGGGEGTALSHPEERIYIQELMTGVSLQPSEGIFNRFTDVSIALLLDTGNYEVDYTKGQPLIWGNGDSIDGSVIDGFATEPPQTVFPDGYLYDSNFVDYCGFDYKYIGIPQLTEVENLGITSNHAFYNPKGLSEIGAYHVLDYMAIKHPYKTCGDKQVCIPGTLVNESGYPSCFDYEFINNELTLSYVDNDDETRKIKCTKADEGKVITYDQYFDSSCTYPVEYKCPNLERFRRTLNLYSSHFESDPFEINNETNPSSSTESTDATTSTSESIESTSESKDVTTSTTSESVESTSESKDATSSTTSESVESTSESKDVTTSTTSESVESTSTESDDATSTSEPSESSKSSEHSKPTDSSRESSSPKSQTPLTILSNVTLINDNNEENYLGIGITKYEFIAFIILGVALCAFIIGLYIVCRKKDNISGKRHRKPREESSQESSESDDEYV